MARTMRVKFASHTGRKPVPYLLRAEATRMAFQHKHRIGLTWDGVAWSIVVPELARAGDILVGSDGREHLVGRDDYITWDEA